MPRTLALTSLLLLVGLSCPAQTTIPSPEDVLGFKPGADGMLADYEQILGYYEKLAGASPRAELRIVGKTTEDRPFASVIISSPRNLARVDQIREDNARLADPRTLGPGEAESILRRGKVIVVLNESIHSTEVGPAQAGMVTAHFLATTEDPAWLEVLDNVVVILTPCHNPDGYAAVVRWWNQNKDTKHRGASLPVLYHKYVGHDNNRDWFMLTQKESRVTVRELHLKWHPQIVIDQHQMGSVDRRGRATSRMFVPPFITPYEPHVHPLLVSQLEHLGRSVVKGMTARGLKGVWCNRRFDGWSPSRAFQHYHGGVRVLTEVA